MKLAKACVLLLALGFFVGCSKDKNMEDFKRDQLVQNLARITSVSGAYTGSVISKLDGTNLGAITLRFQAKTDIQTSEQRAIVSGTLSYKSISSAEIVFDNGYYDNITGDFQVTIPITQEGGIAGKLSLSGVVANDKWNGSIEVQGQSDFGGELDLTKNAPLPNTSSIEVGGTRLQQMKRLDYVYTGAYRMGTTVTPFKMTFINRDILPEQRFYKLFSPVRNLSVNCDFTDFELNFTNAILDDKSGTIVGHDPVDQRGTPARANLSCARFENTPVDFGWDCEVQTKVTLVRLHLNAKQ
jgi:hypothetical protein